MGRLDAREPRQVIRRVEIPKNPRSSYRLSLDSFIETYEAEVITIILERKITQAEAARQISAAAWDRMMRARVRDFS